MSKIDSRLRYLVGQKKKGLAELESTGRFSLDMAPQKPAKARVLVEFTGTADELTAAGMECTAVVGPVATGWLEIDRVADLEAVDSITRIEASRPMHRELDLSVPEAGIDTVHSGTPSYRGAGTIIGIIDSGIDYTHGNFQRPDGTSRILAIWDQSLVAQAGESSPAAFNYGVEYSKADIDADLASANPGGQLRHDDRDTRNGHGTHVSGIAAGDGSVPGDLIGQPAFTFLGAAPDADIIVVANAAGTLALGDSANTLDAVQYIFQTAATHGRPVVINQSQGDNLGPHDGTSLLERGIDNLLGPTGRAMVKSAGNAGNDDIHAGGVVGAGLTDTVNFRIPPGDSATDAMDIWYDGVDRFSIVVTDPNGDATARVNAGATNVLALPSGNEVFIDSVVQDPGNNDNRIYMEFRSGTAPVITAGIWNFSLRGDVVVQGGFDAWIERGQVIPAFQPPHRDNTMTISVPGTAHEIITVGSYVTRGAGVGNNSTFTSQGPTRDGRQAPTLAAPGERIEAPRASTATQNAGAYHQLRGTSMSAPHVTGVVALMFDKNPGLTQQQIRNCLETTARQDVNTGVVPNEIWGHGKLDAQAAVDCVFRPGTFTRFTAFTRFTSLTAFTRLTSFTRLTRLTHFTRFTPLTRFTAFTRLTSLTRFTRFTPLTRFTQFTPFTRFTPFTIFRPTGFWPHLLSLLRSLLGRGSARTVQPFIRFGNSVFDPDELALGNFEDFGGVAQTLAPFGISGLHDVASCEPEVLAGMLGIHTSEAESLVHIAQNLLREL